MNELVVSGKEICRTYPQVKDKALVDLVNGIEVVRDHVRVQKVSRSGLSRAWNMFNGETEQRQAEVNQNLVEGLNVTVDCLMELVGAQERSNLAIARIHERLALLNQDVAVIADYAKETRDALAQFQNQVSHRFKNYELELRRIDLHSRAQQQLDYVFAKWAIGDYRRLPIAARCFMALDELYWGAAGDHLRACQDAQMLETIQNKCSLQMATDARVEVGLRLPTEFWLNSESAILDDMELMAYQGDWSHSQSAAFVQVVSMNMQESHKWPNALPRRIDAARFAEGLLRETLLERIS